VIFYSKLVAVGHRCMYEQFKDYRARCSHGLHIFQKTCEKVLSSLLCNTCGTPPAHHHYHHALHRSIKHPINLVYIIA
jgi:hypothetical protein